MSKLKEYLGEYCTENDIPNPGFNMKVFTHNDMLNFAQYYVDNGFKKEKLNKKNKKG